MKLTIHEMDLFEAACTDLGNEAAQELLNVFAVENGVDVLLLLPSIPLGLLADMVSHLWRAINLEHRKRTGCDLIFVDNAVA
jgi:hypothetical protein